MGDASNRPEGLFAHDSARAREGSMTNNALARACPKCGSAKYTFRSRKQIEATPKQEALPETKYRCRACEHEWKEKVPGVLRKAPLQE
jgi:DNA-directed RNA polymerase subunit M/transcription elongation factor TFIIS